VLPFMAVLMMRPVGRRPSPRNLRYPASRLVLLRLRIGSPMRATLVHSRSVGRATSVGDGYTVLRTSAGLNARNRKYADDPQIVAKARHAVAIAEDGRRGEIRFIGEIGADPTSVRRLVGRLEKRHARLSASHSGAELRCLNGGIATRAADLDGVAEDCVSARLRDPQLAPKSDPIRSTTSPRSWSWSWSWSHTSRQLSGPPQNSQPEYRTPWSRPNRPGRNAALRILRWLGRACGLFSGRPGTLSNWPERPRGRG
jgi:hypothetical protein